MNIFKKFFSGKINPFVFVGVLVLTLLVGFITLITILMGIPKGPNYNSTLGDLNPSKEKLYFAEGPPYNNEKTVKVFSVNTDGSDKKFEQDMDFSRFSLSQMNSVSEGMSSYDGEGKSQDGTREIVINWRELVIRVDGLDKQVVRYSFPFKINIQELFWLSNNRDLLVVTNNGKIGILNTDSLKYAFLTDGWQVSLEKPKQILEFDYNRSKWNHPDK